MTEVQTTIPFEDQLKAEGEYEKGIRDCLSPLAEDPFTKTAEIDLNRDGEDDKKEFRYTYFQVIGKDGVRCYRAYFRADRDKGSIILFSLTRAKEMEEETNRYYTSNLILDKLKQIELPSLQAWFQLLEILTKGDPQKIAALLKGAVDADL